jgi:hypothetical protein|tara:strand:+ start:1897 stop:2130 length:234 start_codon:yes stop_codon:yes gene_type:complete
MNLNKTAKSNLMYIGIVIGIIMLLPLFNRAVVSLSGGEKYKSKKEKRKAEIKKEVGDAKAEAAGAMFAEMLGIKKGK